jgi:hypothetical protein
MSLCLRALAALLAVGAAATAAQAQPSAQCLCYPYNGAPYPGFVRQAPSTFGPGYVSTNQFGGVYGPNYWVRPPFEPFNGLRPELSRASAGCPFPPRMVGFPTHPYARSPRDFYMYE